MSDSIRQIFLPYCLQKQADGRYAVLNRNYKPLGLDTQEFVEYANYPCLVQLKGMTSKRASKMSWEGSGNVDVIFFYNDGSVPTEGTANWAAYASRLETFAKFKIA